MSSLLSAYVVHHTSGRLRFKIPSKKGDPDYFMGICKNLSEVEGVTKVVGNPETGSVVIHYNFDTEKIKELMLENGIILSSNNNQEQLKSRKILAGVFSFFNTNIKQVSSKKLDIGLIAAAVLISAGLYQIARGNFTAIPWYTAFWYGLNLLLKTNSEGLD